MATTREKISVKDYEEVVYQENKEIGLRAIISIHNTNLGPACGGIRVLNYSSRDEALEDVLRLSRGMTYKSALAGIGFGGGKSVILVDPAKKTPALLHAFGEFVEEFKGRYIAAKDMNITSDDLVEVKKKTKHVLGIEGEKGSGGDPSPMTAHGLVRALEATVAYLWDKKDFHGLTLAVQGLGGVGLRVVEDLKEKGADLLVSDINPKAIEAAERFGAKRVDNQVIAETKCDIFVPCARGGLLNATSIPQLKCRAIVGAANNQLATPADGMRLHEKKILYVPDYAANAGGIINIFAELGGYDENKAKRMTDRIFETVTEIFERSEKSHEPPFVVADKIAEERFRGAKK